MKTLVEEDTTLQDTCYCIAHSQDEEILRMVLCKHNRQIISGILSLSINLRSTDFGRIFGAGKNNGIEVNFVEYTGRSQLDRESFGES